MLEMSQGNTISGVGRLHRGHRCLGCVGYTLHIGAAGQVMVVDFDPTPDGAMGYDSGASHQFDKWRHASKRGKKYPVSFNMLFCDGHVGEIASIEDGFTSMRLKFPL